MTRRQYGNCGHRFFGDVICCSMVQRVVGLSFESFLGIDASKLLLWRVMLVQFGWRRWFFIQLVLYVYLQQHSVVSSPNLVLNRGWLLTNVAEVILLHSFVAKMKARSLDDNIAVKVFVAHSVTEGNSLWTNCFYFIVRYTALCELWLIRMTTVHQNLITWMPISKSSFTEFERIKNGFLDILHADSFANVVFKKNFVYFEHQETPL